MLAGVLDGASIAGRHPEHVFRPLDRLRDHTDIVILEVRAVVGEGARLPGSGHDVQHLAVARMLLGGRQPELLKIGVDPLPGAEVQAAIGQDIGDGGLQRVARQVSLLSS